MPGLIFDCDGILADTEALIAQATQQMFRELYDAEIPREAFTPFIGRGEELYTQGPADAYGITIDLPTAAKRREENFANLVASGSDISFPGTNKLIESAHETGWILAIATSSSYTKSSKALKAAQIPLDRFEARITGDDITHKKPHPEIYLRAAEAIGLDPAECIGIEDSTSGVLSVVNAGMRCLAVTNSFTRDELTAAHWVVDSFEEVTLEALDALLRGDVPTT